MKINLFGTEYDIYLVEAEYRGTKPIIVPGKPEQPGRVCILAKDSSDHSEFGRVTVNIPEEELGPNEFFVKTWSENEWVSQLFRAGVIVPTGRSVHTGHVVAPVCVRGPNYGAVFKGRT